MIPHVVDALVLQCLSDALYREIASKAPTNKSFFKPEDHSFSQFSREKDHSYGQFQAWLDFQRSIFQFSRTHPYFVVTDVANYYDTISYTHLRNVISGITAAPEHLLDLLIYVLSSLLWQPHYMPRVEIGLPQINLDAPRLLAHCFLYELDDFLENSETPDFARYMDDIAVGVDSIQQAKRTLKTIDLVLQTRQVRLNSGKTQILTQREALVHFRVRENAELDILSISIERRIGAGLSIAAQVRRVERKIRTGLDRGHFQGGNGEKILKRLISLARRSGASIAHDDSHYILRMWPGTRENVYDYLASRELTTPSVKMLRDFAYGGMVVDDASVILLINSINHTLSTRRVGPETYLRLIARSLDEKSFFGLYSKIWLLSKYGSTTELLSLLQRTQTAWSGNYRLSRLVGGLRPLFVGSAQYDGALRLVARSRNAGAAETWRFHTRLSTDPAVFRLMWPALKSPNTSKATGITHAKFTLLLSALSNRSVPSTQITALLNFNKLVWKDFFYRRWARETLGIRRFP